MTFTSRRGPLRQFAALPRGERRLVLQLVAVALTVRAAIRLAPLTAIAAAIGRMRPRPGAAGIDPVRVAQLVDGTLDRLGSFTCLEKALTLWLALRRRGAHATLTIGVRRNGRALAAHAWVDTAGVPLAGRPDGEYETICSFQSTATAA